MPVLPGLVELAASGQLDAVARLFEFVRYTASDELTSAYLSEQLAVVAHDAPLELMTALRTCPETDRTATLDALVSGLVKQGQADAPLWAALKTAQGSVDPGMAAFAKTLEVTLSQKIAQAKAPKSEPAVMPVQAPATQTTSSVPGG
jgi:D-alanyl-D-alanine carboxypeptidase/D-alanyl-D-alanine-endopeptidase (penicillin-binding protein 4)